MIINIRGTSGSGKSTIIKKVMATYPVKIPVMIKGRKQPLGYYLKREGRPTLAVVGHYEADCGGCDTIPAGHDKVYELVNYARKEGCDVLFEGLLLAAEYIRASNMNKEIGHELKIIALTTPIDQCLASINARRLGNHERRTARLTKINEAKAAKGNKLRPVPEYKGDVRPKNTVVKAKAMANTLAKLEAEGANIEYHSRESALERVLELLA